LFGEFHIHHNVLINQNTNFKSYFDSIKDTILHNAEEGYSIYAVPEFTVKVKNMDDLANKDIKLIRKRNGDITHSIKDREDINILPILDNKLARKLIKDANKTFSNKKEVLVLSQEQAALNLLKAKALKK
jgi:hypothetical protein